MPNLARGYRSAGLPVTYLRRMSSKELSKLQVYTDANFTIPDHEIRYSLFSTEGAQRVPQRANTIIYRLAVRIKRSVRQRCTSDCRPPREYLAAGQGRRRNQRRLDVTRATLDVQPLILDTNCSSAALREGASRDYITSARLRI